MFQPKDTQVYGRQLKVQRLSIPFTVTSNATPANKSYTVDEPALVFFNFQGLTGISSSTGAIDSSGETLPTLATATDSTGVFNVLVKTGEQLAKVVDVKIHSRTGQSGITDYCQILAFTTGSSTSGQSIVANITSGVNFSTTSLDACLTVEYIIQE